MDEQVLNLVLKRMDDHKDENIRRFNSLSSEIKEVKAEVLGISKWQWKVGGISLAAGIIAAAVWKFALVIIEKIY